MCRHAGLLLASALLAVTPAGADSPVGPGGKAEIRRLFSLGKEFAHFTQKDGRAAPEMVISAVFSPDGKVVASAGWDKLIRLWDAATGQPLGSIEGHTGPVYGLAFSPDGRYLASGSEDHTIRLWDRATGKELRQMQGHTRGVTRVAFTPDGRFLASGSYDGSVRLWQVSDGKPVRRFEGQQKGFTTICFSPDGRYLASGCDEHAACLWETATGRVVRRFQGHHLSVVGTAFSPDGYLLATAGEDRAVILWEIWSAKPCLRLRGHRNGAWTTAFSPGGRFVASAGRDRMVRAWDLRDGSPLVQSEAHGKGVPMLAFSPDGRKLASVSHDATAAIWDVSGVRARPAPGNALSAADVADLWEQLALPDAATAYAAMQRLAAAPGQTVPLLRAKVRPTSQAVGQRVPRLLTDIDSRAFRTRQRAGEELEKLAEQFDPALRAALQANPSLEVKQRLERLLARLNGPIASAELLRALRAVHVLELVSTPEARAHLAALADGASGAQLTEAARHALKKGQP